MMDFTHYNAKQHLKLVAEQLVPDVVVVETWWIIDKLKRMIDPKYLELLNERDFEKEAVNVIKQINF